MSIGVFMRGSAFTGSVAHIGRLLADSWLPDTIDDLFS
jgi:hypothetical protein